MIKIRNNSKHRNREAIFHPKIFSTLKNYTWQLFVKDLIAGIIVGVVALPMSIAFGIASGVTPEQGIITAIIAGFLISFLGGSRVQIGGPTGAFIIIVAGIVAQHGIDGLIIATILAGLMLIIMGLFGLGDIIKFIPYPVVVGFTAGIAVVIFSTQMKDFFGMQIENVPAAFHEKWICYFQHFDSINIYATLIAISTVLISFLWIKVNKVIPGTLVAIIIATVAVYYFDLPVETIGSIFGEMQGSIPSPKIPSFDFETIKTLLPAAFTIAMLGAIESLLSAMVADGAIGGKHRSNTELIGQGIANLICPLFGGIPATGAIARTMTNIKNGGRTPIAGIIHAVVLLLILLVFGKFAKLIPMPCLAGILVVVAYNMSEWRSFKGLFKNSKPEIAVLLTTFLLTVIFDLTIAIEVGLVLALVLFVRRVSLASEIKVAGNGLDQASWKKPIKGYDSTKFEYISIPEGVEIFSINGPFFFGVANKFEETAKVLNSKPKIRIIDLESVPFIDATALHNLNSFCAKCMSEKTRIILGGVNKKVKDCMLNHEIGNRVGVDNIFTSMDEAIKSTMIPVQDSE